MMLRLHVSLEHPQERHISRVIDGLRRGEIVVYPTDTSYGLGCDLYAKRSMDRILKLKGHAVDHHMTFLCSDISEVARYALVDNRNYSVLKQHTPGLYTFILPASRDVPKILQSKQRTVGVRIPQSEPCLALIRALGHPLVNTTAEFPQSNDPLHAGDPDTLKGLLNNTVDMMLDGGVIPVRQSTVIDLTQEQPQIIRAGDGPTDLFSA